ncbi:MAG: hypothetical protein AAF363_19390 [Bacteroidota bacterium]
MISQEVITLNITKVDSSNFKFKQTGQLPKKIDEASGLEKSSKKNTFWTHNDDGLPVIYGIDSIGNSVKAIHLGSKNSGWEDLATDNENNLYVGSFGNNKNDRKNLKILKLKDPFTYEKSVVSPEIINYKYEDQNEFPPTKANMNYDVDAMIFFNDSLYLFTKNRTEPFNSEINIYSLPSISGEYVAKKVESFELSKGNMISNWITGAAISPSKKVIALLFHSKILLLTDFNNSSFTKAKFYQIDLNHFSHKAGISFGNSDNKIFIVDEKEFGVLGGNIYCLTFKL